MSNSREFLQEDNDVSPLTPEQEERVEHLVDTTGCSYDDAKRYLDIPVDDPSRLRRLMKWSKIGQRATEIVCGDCYQKLGAGEGCSHIRVGRRGGVYRNDDRRF